jgi:hypothetical protein
LAGGLAVVTLEFEPEEAALVHERRDRARANACEGIEDKVSRLREGEDAALR